MSLHPQQLFTLLLDHFGKQHWWPYDEQYHQQHSTDPRFEIILGAILTQNTAWTNVEKALGNLKSNHTLTVDKIVDVPLDQLRTMIRSSGYYNQKADRVKTVAAFIHDNYNANLDNFFQRDMHIIREELLTLNGIGPETADSIILYAGNHPFFVIDAYTKRICSRIPLKVASDSYADLQQFFQQSMENIQPEQQKVHTYKLYHALLVELAKQICKTKPLCANCPVKNHCKCPS